MYLNVHSGLAESGVAHPLFKNDRSREGPFHILVFFFDFSWDPWSTNCSGTRQRTGHATGFVFILKKIASKSGVEVSKRAQRGSGETLEILSQA